MMRPLLLPLVPLYRVALALRELRLNTRLEPMRSLNHPVISVGSISAGGSGKTPLTIALAQALTARGLLVDVLSRGYGRGNNDVARVDPNGSAEEFGDEPLLIARAAGIPVYVAAQRYEAGLLAEAAGENAQAPIVHLLDDGFQHRQLHRDVNILLLDVQDFSDHLLPAGNLRESLSAIRRADIIALPAGNPDLEAKLKASGWQGAVWRLHRRMEVPRIQRPVVAFCGIARPEQFFAGLEATGLQLSARIAFPDHHRYTQRDMERLQAAACDATLVTTEKDRVRLGTLGASIPVETVPLRTEIESAIEAMNDLIQRLQISG